jgi:hypothetical protein
MEVIEPSMKYDLTQTQVLQIMAWLEEFERYYCDSDILILKNIANKAVVNMYLDETDVYELIEVLPRMIPLPKEEPRVNSEIQNTDWNEYIDVRRARYKREMERLHQVLSNWVFMQSAVYRKNMEPLDRPVERLKSNSIGLGIKK